MVASEEVPWPPAPDDAPPMHHRQNARTPLGGALSARVAEAVSAPIAEMMCLLADIEPCVDRDCKCCCHAERPTPERLVWELLRAAMGLVSKMPRVEKGCQTVVDSRSVASGCNVTSVPRGTQAAAAMCDGATTMLSRVAVADVGISERVETQETWAQATLESQDVETQKDAPQPPSRWGKGTQTASPHVESRGVSTHLAMEAVGVQVRWEELLEPRNGARNYFDGRRLDAENYFTHDREVQSDLVETADACSSTAVATRAMPCQTDNCFVMSNASGVSVRIGGGYHVLGGAAHDGTRAKSPSARERAATAPDMTTHLERSVNECLYGNHLADEENYCEGAIATATNLERFLVGTFDGRERDRGGLGLDDLRSHQGLAVGAAGEAVRSGRAAAQQGTTAAALHPQMYRVLRSGDRVHRHTQSSHEVQSPQRARPSTRPSSARSTRPSSAGTSTWGPGAGAASPGSPQRPPPSSATPLSGHGQAAAGQAAKKAPSAEGSPWRVEAFLDAIATYDCQLAPKEQS